ncbi:MAG: hypothetical protein IT486_11645 [Gammaproteobacteria bacterium]|nr:hypothetical protein [Gammaproteobacteria bacterium]
MNTRFTITLAAAALALWSAGAPASIKNLENAYESDTEHLLLPSAPGGRVVIRECAGCKPVTLRIDRATAFFVGAGTTPVTLAELRTAAAGVEGAARLVTVFYSLDSGVVTRIVLSGN